MTSDATPWVDITVIVVVLAVVLALWMWRHQRMLAERARLMQEAIKNAQTTAEQFAERPSRTGI